MISSSKVTISIVSHGQFTLLLPLIKSLRNCEEIESIIITINIPEKIKKIKWLQKLPIIWIYNSSQQGFGTNHNNAFKMCNTKYFFVINPDVRFSNKIIKDLILLKEKETIVHDAQRQSYSNLNHFKFHLKSYFLNYNL